MAIAIKIIDVNYWRWLKTCTNYVSQKKKGEE